MANVKSMRNYSFLKTGLLQPNQSSIKLPSQNKCFKKISGDLFDDQANFLQRHRISSPCDCWDLIISSAFGILLKIIILIIFYAI